MAISNDELFNWTKPAFDSEREMADATRDVVKNAVLKHDRLKQYYDNGNIRIFPKGSYANNTNVRRNSDIDIAVEYTGMTQITFFDGTTFQDTELSPYTGISALEFKSMLKSALISEFGQSVDASGNKIFSIKGSEKILNADIIPCTTHMSVFSWGKRMGIELILNNPDGRSHINFPDQNEKNGTQKNLATSKRYKSSVRILKNINNNHLGKYHSFMIESLLYNLSNSTYNSQFGANMWHDLINGICSDAWGYLNASEPTTSRWLEVNGCKFLFHEEQIWTRPEAKQFILDVYRLIN